MKCPHCGLAHPDDYQFCPKTGKKLEKVYIYCINAECHYRVPLPLEARFCPNCGSPLTNNATSRNKPKINHHAKAKEIAINGVSFFMVPIRGGKFLMGATSEQREYSSQLEEPAHWENVQDFYISECVVTQELWQAVMEDNHQSGFKGIYRPVTNVAYKDCLNFCKRLSALTGYKFRLPTEVEWEYAARSVKEPNIYSGSDNIQDVAWFGENSNKIVHDVGLKNPNERGLYDMSGNVWEWCDTRFIAYRGSYISADDVKNSIVSKSKQSFMIDSFSPKVKRGGCAASSSKGCRVSRRHFSCPDKRSKYIGFRIATSNRLQ